MILVLVSGVSHNTILLNQTVSLEEIKTPSMKCYTNVVTGVDNKI